MSRPDYRPDAITIELLDRLVEGGLAEAERRELLMRLEREPGGWRRCALAFLESQGWAAALGAGKPKAAFDPDFDAATTPKARPRTIARTVPWLLAAAVVLAGFVAGRASRPRATPPGDDFVQAPAAPAAGESIREVGVLRLASNIDGAKALSLPVLAGPGLDEQWLRNQPSFMPDDVRRTLEDRGYEVVRQRRLVSMQVDDEGRYLAIPIDDVRLKFVGQAL